MIKNETELWEEVVASWENYIISRQNMFSHHNAHLQAWDNLLKSGKLGEFLPEQVLVYYGSTAYLVTIDTEDGKIIDITAVDKVINI